MNRKCLICNKKNFNNDCCEKLCNKCCNGCNHYNRFRSIMKKCSICNIKIPLCRCCNNYCNNCCINKCLKFKYKKEITVYIKNIILESKYYITSKDDILLTNFYNDIKLVLSNKLCINVLELIIKFIDVRKKCYLCNTYFKENNIRYHKCYSCDKFHCLKCISKETIIKAVALFDKT